MERIYGDMALEHIHACMTCNSQMKSYNFLLFIN